MIYYLLSFNFIIGYFLITTQVFDGPAVTALRRAIVEAQRCWSAIGWGPKIYYLKLLRASEGTLNRWPRLHL
jgi:hypothetical protein